MVFQKRSRSQGTQHTFTLGTNQITHTSTGNFNNAVTELRDKACRAFYTIKWQCPVEIPIRIWLKILESVIEPIALYGSEVWGPLTNPNQDVTKWENIQLRPCMQNSVKLYYTCTGIQQITHAEQN